jgi:uncharacterized LabA/DUF88 family protein
MTDVNIATHLIVGALRDHYDTALLMCADADLLPAVREVRAAGKRVIVVSPRGRTSAVLSGEADAHLHVATSLLGKCQLPEVVHGGAVVLRRPVSWK